MEATPEMSRSEEIAQLAASMDATTSDESADEAPVEVADAPESAEDAVEAAPEPEPTPDVAPEKPAAPDRSWQALEAREAELVRRDKQMKEMMQALEAQRAQIPTMDPKEAFIKKYQSDPMSAVKEFGVDPTALVEAFVNADDPTPDYLHKQATGEVDKVRERLEQLERQLQQERYQNQVMTWQKGASEVLQGEEYDKVRKFSALDGTPAELIAHNIAVKYHQEHGRLLTPEESCAKLKAVLDERWNAAFPDQSSPAPTPPKAKGATTGLTNDVTEPRPPSIAMHPKSRREEIEEILKTAKF